MRADKANAYQPIYDGVLIDIFRVGDRYYVQTKAGLSGAIKGFLRSVNLKCAINVALTTLEEHECDYLEDMVGLRALQQGLGKKGAYENGT